MRIDITKKAVNDSASFTECKLEDLKGKGATRSGHIWREGDTIIFPENESEVCLKFQTIQVTTKEGTKENREVPLLMVLYNNEQRLIALSAFRKLPFGKFSEPFREANPVNEELLAGDFFDLINRTLGKSLKVSKIETSKRATFKGGQLVKDVNGEYILEDSKFPVFTWM